MGECVNAKERPPVAAETKIYAKGVFPRFYGVIFQLRQLSCNLPRQVLVLWRALPSCFAGAFWIYAVISVAGFVFIKLRLPETKGKTLEEIEVSWSR